MQHFSSFLLYCRLTSAQIKTLPRKVSYYSLCFPQALGNLVKTDQSGTLEKN